MSRLLVVNCRGPTTTDDELEETIQMPNVIGGDCTMIAIVACNTEGD